MQGGCIIRAGFLDDIKQAYERNLELHNLLVDPYFGEKVAERQEAWREVIKMAITAGVAVPGLSISLAYFDSYRSVLPTMSFQCPAQCPAPGLKSREVEV